MAATRLQSVFYISRYVLFAGDTFHLKHVQFHDFPRAFSLLPHPLVSGHQNFGTLLPFHPATRHHVTPFKQRRLTPSTNVHRYTSVDDQ